jgi:hypothetical protein
MSENRTSDRPEIRQNPKNSLKPFPLPPMETAKAFRKRGDRMEISPIPGIRMLQAVRTPPAEAGLTARFEIDASARAGDDSYTGSSKKGAGAEENDEEELMEEAEAQAEGQLSDHINFFA